MNDHSRNLSAPSKVTEFLASPTKALWKLSLPILGGMLIHTLYSLVDMLFVGWIGPEDVAALSFNVPLVFLAYGLTMGLSTGVTAVIAQAIGARDKERADNAAEHAVFLGLMIGISLSLAGLAWGRQMLGVLGAAGDVQELGWAYFRVMCWGLIFSVMASFFRGILAGEGDTMRPMMILGSGMILNIILDPVFIFGLDLGVVGAAVATVTSQMLVFLIFVYMIFRQRRTYVAFKLRHFRFQLGIL
ncbi:MATE family efflux transporter, partial [Candidatus Neomarinimicrobiota bacterium]